MTPIPPGYVEMELFGVKVVVPDNRQRITVPTEKVPLWALYGDSHFDRRRVEKLAGEHIRVVPRETNNSN